MPKVSIITLPFRKTHLIKPVYQAIFAQTHKDIEVIAIINDPIDGSKELLQKEFSQVKIIIPGWNTWFAVGNNIGMKESSGEFILLTNDDLILEPNYVEKLLKDFADPRVAAATGKILRYDFKNHQKTNIIDSTGLIMWEKWMTGRIRDRGQMQEDRGQFDTPDQRVVFGVTGAAAMFRRAALEQVKFCENGKCEYFDDDFLAYWEDADLSWRFNHAGYQCVYEHGAVCYHGRSAGQSKGGYVYFWRFIKHHRTIPAIIRRLNYKNHILMYIKNAEHLFHPGFIIRELGMLGYIIIFETSTLKVVPELIRLIPKFLRKRKHVMSLLKSSQT